ncbi:hypothetical protein MHK_001696, partial [Candidatus Magnetomorum sp. HK-1]
EKMLTISFAETNESMHAAIANFDSWQNWIHIINNQGSEDTMKIKNP